MPAMPHSNIHLDILMGRDEALDVADFFGGGFSCFTQHYNYLPFFTDMETAAPLDIHADMERKLRL